MSSQDLGAIADRYSAALFDLAAADAALDAVAADLTALKAMTVGSADLRRLLQSPVIRRSAQSDALLALADKAGWHALTKKFIGLMAQNRRLFVLNSVIDAYLARLAAERGDITAHVVSATPLGAAQQKSLTAALNKAIGRNVLLDLAVDPGLLGGLVTKVGSTMVDASLKTKLQQLTLALKGVR